MIVARRTVGIAAAVLLMSTVALTAPASASMRPGSARASQQSGPTSKPATQTENERIDDCINMYNSGAPTSETLSYFILSRDSSIGRTIKLYCGKETRTERDRGVVHIESSHDISWDVNAFVQCLSYTIEHGRYLTDVGNPDYVGYLNQASGHRTARVIVWSRGGYDTVITAYTGGPGGNQWVSCRRS